LGVQPGIILVFEHDSYIYCQNGDYKLQVAIMEER